MTQLPDYHRFSSISEYMEATNAAGIHLPILACWLIQTVMKQRGCSFAEAMDDLTGTSTLVLLPATEGGGESRWKPLPPTTERMKDLDD